MWTLYDPLVRQERSDPGVGERRRENLKDQRANPPRAQEKLWFLLEPIEAISKRVRDNTINH